MRACVPHLRLMKMTHITGLIKLISERFVGVATLLDNTQGSAQVFLAPRLGRVTCSLKDD